MIEGMRDIFKGVVAIVVIASVYISTMFAANVVSSKAADIISDWID